MIYKVLHLLSTKTLNGAEKVALDICTNLDKDIFNPIIVCAGDEVRGYFEKEAIESFNINISNLNIKEILKLRKLLKNEKIDLIHAHDVRASIAAKLASINLNIAVISHIHVEYEWLKNRSILKIIDGLFRSSYSLSLACSIKVKEFYCAYNRKCNKEKIIALPNSFNFSEINKFNVIPFEDFKAINNIPKDKYVFGYIGRLISLKGIDLLLESFNLFQERYPNSILIIVGEGVEKEKLINLAKEHDLSTKIYFKGYRKDVYNWLNIYDSFILPSKREGLPLTILEAMAMKKIVISTSIGGIPELIKNNYNGILIEERSPQLLMKSMEYVYENEDEVRQIVENAYNNLRLNYGIKDYINDLQNIYKSLLKLPEIDSRKDISL
ncbi:glycosyltransferase [Clostridium algoriphilum]|uniref:glycosyltransferase n=1 Tax=Clostridium algoriphilum TaxID=198347 RepID=UPI001CF5047F|nr:glycosyltransferase [Clostridium algoriphilum]MCB2295197.1 glycosyltransferase [Clostridium algoriphilum]